MKDFVKGFATFTVAVLLGGAVFSLILILGFNTLIQENPRPQHIDPLAVQLGVRDNQILLTPELKTGDPREIQSPTYALDADQLVAKLDEMILSEPRAKMIGGAKTFRWMTYVQRSRFLRFPDFISVRVLSAGEGRSTMVIYSRSLYGERDLGVNRDRVERWLKALAPFVADDLGS